MQIELIDYVAKIAIPADLEIVGSDYVITFPYNKNILQDIKGLEGAKWNPDIKSWTFTKDSARNRFILGYLTNGKYEWPNTLKNYFTPVPQITTDRPLYKKQLDMLGHIVHFKRVLLVCEMGTGKTIVNIEAMERKKRELLENCKKTNTVLPADKYLFWVIAPNAPLKAWEYELRKWNSIVTPRLIGNHPNKIAEMIAAAEYPPIYLAVDESSRFKNPTAKRSQLLRQLTEMMELQWQGNEIVTANTGTPAPKEPTDWYNQIESVRPGWFREKNLFKFRERLADMVENVNETGQRYKTVLGWKKDEIDNLHKRLKGVAIFVKKADIVELPAKVYNEINVTPTEEYMRLAGIIVNSATSAVGCLNSLRQLSDGFQYSTIVNEGHNRFKNNPKLDALVDAVDSLKEEEKNRVVIYAAYTESVDMIVDKLLEASWGVIRVDGRGWNGYGSIDNGSAVIPVQPTLKQFQNDNLDVPIAFVSQADSGGMGITLTASDTIIYYSSSFNAESRMQSEDRIHRIGMKGANIIDLVHLPTDKMVLDNIKGKKELQSITMGDIKNACCVK